MRTAPSIGRIVPIVILAAFVVLSTLRAATAQDGRAALQTNEAMIEGLSKSGSLAVDDPLAVFGFVFDHMPDSVQVFPTENYYYFHFTENGVPYAGNIRLAAGDRDDGKLSFSYGERPTDWNDKLAEHNSVLDASRGVVIERVVPLQYRVSYRGRSVRFVLNDLSKVAPAAGLLRPDERFLGPVFDESGLRFLLLFNARLRVFHYILDETAPMPDRLAASAVGKGISIGKRSGFAFYQDGDRKILIGVSARQSLLNTFFDGPFDQLPENFIAGETLRDAILAVSPETRGKIDRLGNFADGSGRYLIHPYMLYRRLDDLAAFARCAAGHRVRRSDRPLCFVIDDQEAQRISPRPLAMKRRRE